LDFCNACGGDATNRPFYAAKGLEPNKIINPRRYIFAVLFFGSAPLAGYGGVFCLNARTFASLIPQVLGFCIIWLTGTDYCNDLRGGSV